MWHACICHARCHQTTAVLGETCKACAHGGLPEKEAILSEEASLQRSICACSGSIGHCGSAPQSSCYTEDRVCPLCPFVGRHAVRAQHSMAAVPVQNLRTGCRPHCRRAVNTCIRKAPSQVALGWNGTGTGKGDTVHKEGGFQLWHTASHTGLWA